MSVWVCVYMVYWWQDCYQKNSCKRFAFNIKMQPIPLYAFIYMYKYMLNSFSFCTFVFSLPPFWHWMSFFCGFTHTHTLLHFCFFLDILHCVLHQTISLLLAPSSSLCFHFIFEIYWEKERRNPREKRKIIIICIKKESIITLKILH